MPGIENLSQGAQGKDNKIGFPIASGAYFLETNVGGGGKAALPDLGANATIGAYRVNAATAQFSRIIAIA